MCCFGSKKRQYEEMLLYKQMHPDFKVPTSLEINVNEKINVREDTSSIITDTDPPPPYEFEKSALEAAPRQASPLFEVNPDSPAGPPSLITIPANIHRHLFDILAYDPATSLCLALTCKRFYVICEAQQGHMKVDLNTHTPCIHAGTTLRKGCGHKEFLYQYLEDWVPEGYYFEWRLRKFIPMPLGRRGDMSGVIGRAWDWAEGALTAEEEDVLYKKRLDSVKQKARMVALELN